MEPPRGQLPGRDEACPQQPGALSPARPSLPAVSPGQDRADGGALGACVLWTGCGHPPGLSRGWWRLPAPVAHVGPAPSSPGAAPPSALPDPPQRGCPPASPGAQHHQLPFAVTLDMRPAQFHLQFMVAFSPGVILRWFQVCRKPVRPPGSWGWRLGCLPLVPPT